MANRRSREQLLGVPQERFGNIMVWLSDYGAAAAAAGTGIPALTPELLARGHRGAQALFDLVSAIKIDDEQRGHSVLLGPAAL